MSQIMKTFLGVYIILLMTLSVMGILGAFLTVLSAQNMHSQIITELEDSDFSRQVIRSCFEQAQKAGQSLTLELYSKQDQSRVCNSWQEAELISYEIDMARVELKFDFEVAFFEIKSSHVLSGFDR